MSWRCDSRWEFRIVFCKVQLKNSRELWLRERRKTKPPLDRASQMFSWDGSINRRCTLLQLKDEGGVSVYEERVSVFFDKRRKQRISLSTQGPGKQCFIHRKTESMHRGKAPQVSAVKQIAPCAISELFPATYSEDGCVDIKCSYLQMTLPQLCQIFFVKSTLTIKFGIFEYYLGSTNSSK